MSKCYVCYEPLAQGQLGYHPTCAKKLFGSVRVPHLAISQAQLLDFAQKAINVGATLTGVQPKLSLDLDMQSPANRMTLVGMVGGYILKPQTPHFSQLPENEHLTMLFASTLGLPTATCGLVRLEDDSLGYLTRRFDRDSKKAKLAMEDMAQLTGVLTEYKYRSSLEKVAKAIQAYSQVPGQDKLYFLMLGWQCFLTGNADMHLKNFAMVETQHGWRLAPAYDLVNTKLAMPTDREQFALPLHGKKNRLTREDLVEYLGTEVLSLPPKVVTSALAKTQKALAQWPALIEASFLSDENKATYLAIVQERAADLHLDV